MNKLYLKITQRFFCFLIGAVLVTQSLPYALYGATSIGHTIEDIELEKKVDQLLLLIQKRLVIMHEVARTKWNHNLVIEDKPREQQILADLVEKASKYSLSEKIAMDFFEAQIEASKEIQKNDFALWREQGVVKFDSVFNLKDELRIYIDQINQEMIVLLSEIYRRDNQSVVGKLILKHPISTRVSDDVTNNVWLMAISPLTL